nr:MAG TPA: hypothetical protein [Caudoviricetes sp.]
MRYLLVYQVYHNTKYNTNHFVTKVGDKLWR